MSKVLPLSLILLLALTSPSFSTTHHVPGEYGTIQAAMDAAAEGDTVQVDTGVYTGPGNQDLILLNKSLTLMGAGSAATLIDCQSASRALSSLQLAGGTLRMKHLGISAGASAQAAGLLLSGGAAVLVDVVLSDCASGGEGGAVHASNMDQLSLWDLGIAGCTATGDGGGIYLDNISSLVIDRCAIDDCEAQATGGGLYMRDIPAMDIEELSVTNCEAQTAGGGIYLDDVDGEIRETLVTDNSCPGECGGIYVPSYCNITLRGLTLAGNLGSALQIEGSNSIVLEQGLVASNAGGNGAIEALYHNFDISCSDVHGNSPSNYGSYGDQTGINGNISEDPRFCDAGNGDYSVDNHSPCLPENNGCGLLMGALGQDCFDIGFAIRVPEDYPTIGEAVAAAETGDSIVVAAGLYTGPNNRDVDFDGKALHIIGYEGSEVTIIDCEGQGRAFYAFMSSDELSAGIEGFTIRNGDILWYGGALCLNANLVLTLRDLVIEDCVSPSNGGGIYVRYTHPGSEFSEITITGCSANKGGGFYADNAKFFFHDALIAGNTAWLGSGGGFYSGVHNQMSATRLSIVGNEGGGAYFYSGAPGNSHEMSSSIVSHGAGDAPGISASAGGADNVSFHCNDVWGNAGGNYDDELGDLTNIDGNISLDPLFCDMEAGDYSLSESSPCLPAGNACGLQMGVYGQGCAGIEAYMISGTIRDEEGDPLPGVRVYWGGTPAETFFDGSYVFTVAEGWSGVAQAHGGCYDYTPTERVYTDVQEDWADQDYTGAHRTHAHVPGDYDNLGDAVLGCFDGDSIFVAPGVYESVENGQIHLSVKNLVVIGTGGSAATIFEGDLDDWEPLIIFEGPDQSSKFMGLTFRDASFYDMSNGTVIKVIEASPVFEDLVLEDIRAWGDPWQSSDGVAMRIDGGSPEFHDCLVRDNSCDYGPITISDGTPLFEDVRFEINRVNVGPLRILGGAPVFRDCTFDQNIAQARWYDDFLVHGKGGAVSIGGGSPLFEDCLFTENYAEADYPVAQDPNAYSGYGGAVYLSDGSPVFSRCTFHGNGSEIYDEAKGGCFGVFGGLLTLEQVIVAGGIEGGGIYLDAEGGGVVMSCNDVWNNIDGDYVGSLPNQTGQNGNISANPIFCDASTANFTLHAISPCLPENNDCGLRMGAFGQGCEGGTAAGETPATAFALLQNRPNPFNPSTQIVFVLPSPARVDLAVFDITGRRVATLLADEAHEAGTHVASWEGRDDADQRAASGVYFYRLEADGFSDVRKMLLLK